MSQMAGVPVSAGWMAGIRAMAFDSQKKSRNYKNPLTGSVHASRGLPHPVDIYLARYGLVRLAGRDPDVVVDHPWRVVRK
jgi:hypothetical protein